MRILPEIKLILIGNWNKQEQLLQMLRDHKSMTPQQIWDGIGVAKRGALDPLRPLMRAGLVKRVGTKKSGRYILA